MGRTARRGQRRGQRRNRTSGFGDTAPHAKSLSVKRNRSNKMFRSIRNDNAVSRKEGMC